MKRLEITPGFWCAVGLLWLSGEEALTAPLLLAVAAHEAGHLFALRWLGAPLRAMRLGFLDARILTGLLSYRQELLAALAGPLVSLACAMALRQAAPVFAAVSLLLGVFNLLPVWPLDGGRVLHAGLCLRLAPARARSWTRRVGLCSCALALGGALWLASAYGAGMLPVLFWCVIFTRLARYGREEGN